MYTNNTQLIRNRHIPLLMASFFFGGGEADTSVGLPGVIPPHSENFPKQHFSSL